MNKELLNEMINQANNGNEQAQMALAELYFKGLLGKPDYNESIKYLKMASKTNKYAPLQIANMFDNGIGVFKNPSESFKILEESANNYSNELAMYQVGRRLLEGYGVTKNIEKGLSYLEEASALGEAESTFLLGYYYQSGENVEKDSNKALKYYEKAAELKNARACYNIGFMYYNEELGEKNYEKALEWLKKAKELGMEIDDLIDKISNEMPYSINYTFAM